MRMVERVARALAAEDGIAICSDATYAQSSYGPRARAALQALMEPTDDMAEAGAWEIICKRDGSEVAQAYACWQAMIRSAMEGE